QMHFERIQRTALAYLYLNVPQTPSETQHPDRSTGVPARFVLAGGVERRPFDIHPFGLAMQVGCQSESGNSTEFLGTGIPLAQIHCMHELVSENLSYQEITGFAAEVISGRRADEEFIGENDGQHGMRRIRM